MRVLPLLVIVLMSVKGYSQKTDTAFLTASIFNARQGYNASMKGEWPINTGGQFVEYISIKGEHPFLIPNWSYGTLRYLGDVYYNVPLLLDLRGDRLITLHSIYGVKIELNAGDVSNFAFAGHRFVHLLQDSVKGLPESGFYDLLESGKVSLLARRQKTIKRDASSGKEVVIMKESNRYFLMKNKEAIPVKSRQSVMSALTDRPDLKTNIKKSAKRFRRDKETALSAIVHTYNELNDGDAKQ